MRAGIPLSTIYSSKLKLVDTLIIINGTVLETQGTSQGEYRHISMTGMGTVYILD